MRDAPRSRSPARYLGTPYATNAHGERWRVKLFDAAGDRVAYAEFGEDDREGGRGSRAESVNLRTGRYRSYRRRRGATRASARLR